MKIINKKYKDIKSFTIKESIWARGNQSPEGLNALLNKDRTMCCLGQYGKSCGISNDVLYMAGVPSVVEKVSKNKAWIANLNQKELEYVKWETKLISRRAIFDTDCDSTICDDLVEINDDVDISDEERKVKLKKKFAEMKVKVRFIK